MTRKPRTPRVYAGRRFTVDATKPAQDGVFDVAAFETFLKARIKVKGKAGMLGSSVDVKRDNNRVTVKTTIKMSKRYIKYLTKKYLKKETIRDWLRVVKKGKRGYELRYFDIHGDQAEEAADE